MKYVYSLLLFTGITILYAMEPKPTKLSAPCDLHIKSDNSMVVDNIHYLDIKKLIESDPALAAKLLTYLGAKTRILDHKVKKQEEEIQKLKSTLISYERKK